MSSVFPTQVFTAVPHDRLGDLHLSPVTDYYIRKLLRQQLSQLTSTRLTEVVSADLAQSPIALFDRLRQLHGEPETIALQLDALVLRHQTLRTQGGRYQSELKQVEVEILECFALKRTQSISQARIVIIDDTLETLRLLTTTLIEQGYAVEQLSNGGSVLNHIREIKPDLILLDIMMPGVDGYEICERLKLDPATAQIPIVFLSAINDESEKVKAFDLGAVDYIAKPFQLGEVMARVEYQLKLYHLQQRSQQSREAERSYQNFFDHAVVGMFRTSVNGRFIQVNQALATVLGYRSPEDLYQSIDDIARQLYTVPQRRSQFILYLEQYDKIEEFEAEVFCKNGDRIWIRETARAVRDDEGTLKYYEGTLQDITAQKRLDSAPEFRELC